MVRVDWLAEFSTPRGRMSDSSVCRALLNVICARDERGHTMIVQFFDTSPPTVPISDSASASIVTSITVLAQLSRLRRRTAARWQRQREEDFAMQRTQLSLHAHTDSIV
jgi:hypothetical protein